MGSVIGKLFNSLFGKKEMRILMVGLDAAGKTTILYKLKLGQVVTTIPTIGFNVEQVSYKNVCFICWDVGGRGRGLRLWRHYLQNTSGIIFVIDSNDKERLSGDENGFDVSVKEVLHDMLNEQELLNIPLLIFANKQDLPNSMSINEIKNKLDLEKTGKDRKWHIQSSCAKTGDGLYEGLDWLSNTLNGKK